MTQPSWLTENTAKTVASNPTAQKMASAEAGRQVEQVTGVPGGAAPTNSQGHIVEGMDDDQYAAMKKWHLYLRMGSMLNALLMSIAAVLVITDTDPGPSVGIIAAYVFFFSIIIFCFELGLKTCANWLANNFGFMYSVVGRSIFMMFVSAMCYRLALFGKIVMGCVLGVSFLLNGYIICKFPKFPEYQRKLHFYTH
jgi:hypothetical protein